MDGTHKRMVEALEKGCDIYYLCRTWDQAHEMTVKSLELYGPYGLTPHPRGIQKRILNWQPKGTIVRFEPLSFSTYEKLLGFSGCVLVHPDTYSNLLNPEYDYKNVQELIINCNVRNRPWLP